MGMFAKAIWTTEFGQQAAFEEFFILKKIGTVIIVRLRDF